MMTERERNGWNERGEREGGKEGWTAQSHSVTGVAGGATNEPILGCNDKE